MAAVLHTKREMNTVEILMFLSKLWLWLMLGFVLLCVIDALGAPVFDAMLYPFRERFKNPKDRGLRR